MYNDNKWILILLLELFCDLYSFVMSLTIFLICPIEYVPLIV